MTATQIPSRPVEDPAPLGGLDSMQLHEVLEPQEPAKLDEHVQFEAVRLEDAAQAVHAKMKDAESEQSPELKALSTTKRSTCNTGYSYTPLNPNGYCMRLIRFTEGTTKDGTISCELQEVTFGDQPKFEALSYMWVVDGVQETRTILLGGMEKEFRHQPLPCSAISSPPPR